MRQQQRGRHQQHARTHDFRIELFCELLDADE
jgi:hypothetical protein